MRTNIDVSQHAVGEIVFWVVGWGGDWYQAPKENFANC
jgi:hypothetical protein